MLGRPDGAHTLKRGPEEGQGLLACTDPNPGTTVEPQVLGGQGHPLPLQTGLVPAPTPQFSALCRQWPQTPAPTRSWALLPSMGLSLQGLLPANTQGPLSHVLAPGLGGDGAGTTQLRCREATLGTQWGGGLALDTGRLGPSRGNALLHVRSVGRRVRFRGAEWPGHPVPTELRVGVILASPTSLEAQGGRAGASSGLRPQGSAVSSHRSPGALVSPWEELMAFGVCSSPAPPTPRCTPAPDASSQSLARGAVET